jgi:hypothetical protein
LHRPRDSAGGSTDRHYSTIHSVTQSYVTKAFHLQAHCGNPAILIAAARYPLQSLLLLLLPLSPGPPPPHPPHGSSRGRPRSPHSAPPPAICPPRPRESLFCVPELRIFPVLRILFSYGSVPRWQQSNPRFRRRRRRRRPRPSPLCPVSSMQTRRADGCSQTLLRAADATPIESLKCSRAQEMFFKRAICQMTLNVAKQ